MEYLSLLNSAQLRIVERANRAITKADWRFLLSNPYPGNTLCLVDGSLVKTLQLFSKTELYSGVETGSSEYDLVVLRNPDDNELRYAMSILKPGASCYVEWDVNIFFTPSSITKRLKDVGFESVDQYMTKPDPDKGFPGSWIPLESYGAVNYLFANRNYKSLSILKRAGKMVLYAFWLLSPGIFVKFPWLIGSGASRFKVCSIACKPSIEDKGSDINKYKSGLMEIERLLPDNNRNNRSAEISTMIISGGMQRLNKVVIAVFSGDSPKPSYILKIPRTMASESVLKNEANMLQVLIDNYNLTNGIPRVLYADQRLGFFSVGETYIDGKFLGEVCDRNKLPRIAKKLTYWLIDLAKRTANRLPGDWKNTHINPLTEMLKGDMPNLPDENLVNKAIDTITSLDIPTFVCEHRDFAPWNILVAADEQLGVLDWESSRINGIPGLDLIYFLTYLCLYVEEAWTKEKALECYKKLLDSNEYLGRLCRDCINLYANELGISPQSIKPLRIITWITHMDSVSKQLPHENLVHRQIRLDSERFFQSLIEYEMSIL